jgi:gamma-resorcylate decarboxylase
MFSADYPFEDLLEGAEWFDNADIDELDRRSVGRDNAKRLLKL